MNNRATPVTQADKNREKLKEKREVQLQKKELQLNILSEEAVLTELKAKGLPTFGTKQEKLDRLKKYHGINCKSYDSVSQSSDLNDNYAYNNPPPPQQKPNILNNVNNNIPPNYGNPYGGANYDGNNNGGANNQNVNPGPDSKQRNLPKSTVVDEIEKMKAKREERRVKMEGAKREKAERAAENEALGRNGDVDFELMVDKYKLKEALLQQHIASSKLKLCVTVRKRPLFKKEAVDGELDSISCANPQIIVHECKLKVDGITKYVENHNFTFDNTFNEHETSDDVYKYSVRPLVEFILNQGIVTCFAYGQTGSGKTFTMKGVQENVIKDMFIMSNAKYGNLGLRFSISFYEIYGGRCYDLLNNKNKLNILEDKNQNVQIQGLVERGVASAQEMFGLMEYANSVRTTHQTVSNDTSSRSHAICQINLRDSGEKVYGKLLLVDLAGSERAQDTQSNNRQRRIEGAEINKSLLALKECIRAMDDNKSGANNHVPFRASKLTLVLRDSFISKTDRTRIVMIACICPGSSSADHSLNTLRYADRLKDRKSGQQNLEKLSYNEDQNYFDKPITYPTQQQQQQQQNFNKAEPKTNQPPPASRANAPPSNNNLSVNQQPKRNEENKSNVGHSNAAAAQKKKPVVVKRVEKDPYACNIDQIPEKDGEIAESDSEEDEREPDESPIQMRKKANDDLRFMKETLKIEQKNRVSNEYFDFQEKINTILDEQEEIFSTHMHAIKEDAKLLTQESELISNVQGVGVVDYDIDSYVQKMEHIIKSKLGIYMSLDKKISKFKAHLKEEEEASSKIKETFYY